MKKEKKNYTLKERRAEKQKKNLKKIVDCGATMSIYSVLLITIGANIFIFSNVAFKLQSKISASLLLGNFVAFGIFSYMYLTELKKLEDEK